MNSLPTILLLSMLIDLCSDNLWNIEGIRILQSGKLLLVESGILGFGIRDTAARIRNFTSDWNPESKFADKGWNLVTGIRNTRRGIQNPRLSWIPALTCGGMTYRTLGESSGYWVLIVITVTMLCPVFTANPPISEALS